MYKIDNIQKYPFDSRDYIFQVHSKATKGLPKKIDLREYSRDIEDQLNTGS